MNTTDYELIIIGGTDKGRRYSLKKGLTAIGRDTDNDIILKDELVSRHHCAIKRQKGGIMELRDTGSTNKCIVNKKEVSKEVLSIGDQIRIGGTTFLFTAVKDETGIHSSTNTGRTTKVISVTEKKISPYENKLLDLKELGDNVGALKRAHRDLSTIYKISSLINSIQDTASLLDTLAGRLIEFLQPDRVVLMLFGNGRGKIINKIVRTKKGSALKGPDISMSMVWETVTEASAVLSYDALADERFMSKQSVILNRIRSAMCAPIRYRDTVLGVVYADTNTVTGRFSEQDLRFLSAVGDQAGIAVQNARLYEDMDELFTGALRTLVAAIEAKDAITSGHSERITVFSTAIGKEMGLSRENLRILRISALLHDIGKIGVPENILGKPAPLNKNEFIRMREHPARGAEIIKNIKNVPEVVKAVRHHHEHYDGTGTPDGLKGENIPLLSRIISVSDAFDAMIFDRPYRKGIETERAVSEIKRCRGTQFDPDVVDAFVRAYRKGIRDSLPPGDKR